MKRIKKEFFDKMRVVRCNTKSQAKRLEDILSTSDIFISKGKGSMEGFYTDDHYHCFEIGMLKRGNWSSCSQNWFEEEGYKVMSFKTFIKNFTYNNADLECKLICNDKTIILISPDGDKGVVKCSEGDEFDFGFGCELAKAKLEGRKDDVQKLIEERYGCHEMPIENNMIPAYENTEGKFEQGYTRYKNIDEYIKDTVVASGEDVKLKLIEYIQNDLVTIDTKAFILNILSNKNFINKTEIVRDNSYRNCALSINYDKVRVSASGGLYKAKPAFTLGDIVKHFDKNAEKIFIYLDEQKYTRMFRW